MRAAVLLLAFLAGCAEQKADKATLEKVEAEQKRAAGEDDAVACALPGQPMQRNCVVERTQGGDEGLVLTIRHPDGAFRRLLVTRDGRGVTAADGAEPATFSVVGADRIEVMIAGERYLLPATVKQASGKGGGASR